MNAHLTLAEYGQFVGIKNECLTVKENNVVKEYPLNRIKSIQIAKQGVSFSSDVILACTNRGIKFFLFDFKNEITTCLSGTQQHAVVRVRQKQFSFINNKDEAIKLAAIVIAGKIKNQRATLLYFKKYHQDKASIIEKTCENLKVISHQVKTNKWNNKLRQNILLGLEGQAATQYWQCLAKTNLMPEDFKGRVGRQAKDIGNKSLNYAYAILTSYIWNALINAGLEPYAGFFHSERAGKPSLVLDMMEEYRAWVVDRNIIKHRTILQDKNELTPTIKKQIINDIHKTFVTKYHYRKQKMRLESILQRQIYHLAGVFADSKKYKAYSFRW